MSLKVCISQGLYRGYELFPFVRPILRLGNRISQRVFSAVYRTGYPIEVAGHHIKIDADFSYHARRSIAYDDLLEIISSSISTGDTILDVGGWIGIFSICFGQTVGKSGHVYTFEPTPESFRLLKIHIKLNNLEENIFPFQMAIGNRVGNVIIANSDLSSENKILTDQATGETSKIEVSMTSIDTFCSVRQIIPNVIKIDIEGYELQALMGAKNTITKYKPLIYCELHPFLWQAEDTQLQIRQLLKELHYKIISYGERRESGKSVEFVCLKAED